MNTVERWAQVLVRLTTAMTLSKLKLLQPSLQGVLFAIDAGIQGWKLRLMLLT